MKKALLEGRLRRRAAVQQRQRHLRQLGVSKDLLHLVLQQLRLPVLRRPRGLRGRPGVRPRRRGRRLLQPVGVRSADLLDLQLRRRKLPVQDGDRPETGVGLQQQRRVRGGVRGQGRERRVARVRYVARTRIKKVVIYLHTRRWIDCVTSLLFFGYYDYFHVLLCIHSFCGMIILTTHRPCL